LTGGGLKIVAIHQPQFIPWIPYFDKILQSDIFVLLDDVQFQKNGLQNRNRIKGPGGPQWITVPVVHAFGQRIRETRIASPRAIEKHWRTIRQCYSNSAFFREILPLIADCLQSSTDMLNELNCCIIENILGYIGYQGNVYRQSSLHIEGRSNDLLLSICRYLGANCYLAGQGSKAYLQRELFAQSGIDVIFQNYRLPHYNQLFERAGFFADLSVIDLLFNEGDRSRELIESGRLEVEAAF